MNKKLNTGIFLVVGTLVNLVLAVLCIAVLFVAISFLRPVVGDSLVNWIPFAIIGGIILAMIIYQRIMNWALEKFHLMDMMEPWIKSKFKKPKAD